MQAAGAGSVSQAADAPAVEQVLQQAVLAPGEQRVREPAQQTVVADQRGSRRGAHAQCLVDAPAGKRMVGPPSGNNANGPRYLAPPLELREGPAHLHTRRRHWRAPA
eukprot:CAMPEP_0179868608 /NCGR_PEP_ID=MMETSP0982-20121206/18967_1 /TAXON_ID=483367 /ORGANISM="non described non described, Strain CCMP 2436" /LENGTH=106 /DNA_ID=CAMNT_0021758391 /DNA_START=97 /DNA_END=417 /DNA_ORIENTATION=+